MVGMIILIGIAGFVMGAIFIGIVITRKYGKELVNRKLFIEKLLHIVRTYDVWMMVKREKKSVEGFLKERGIHSIAIYGMSDLGNRLYQELKDGEIEVKYGIDRNTAIQIKNFQIIKPMESGEAVDAVVVTALTTFDLIKGNLEKRGYKNILALDEILYDLL